MTHHPRRTVSMGPRRMQLRTEYAQRRAFLLNFPVGAAPEHGTILAARAATETNARDRAERLRGGPGDARGMSYDERLRRYERQNHARRGGMLPGPLTVAQKRQLRRQGGGPVDA